ncbi:MAG: hypothetical protein V1921_06820 [Candidatus Altiarchaeota archaeon]
MGFFDRFFKGDDHPAEVGFAELGEFLDDEAGRLNETVGRSLKPVIKEIAYLKERLKDDITLIDESDVPEGLQSRFKSIVRTSKPRFTASMLDLADHIRPPETLDYKAAVDFLRSFSDCLERVAKLNFGEGRYLPMAFEKPMTDIRETVKGMVSAKKSLEEIVESNRRIATLYEARQTFNDLANLRDELSSQEAGKLELKKAIGGLESNLEGLTSDYRLSKSALEDSELVQERDSARAERRSVEDAVFAVISQLKRPLRKYRRTALAGGLQKNVLAALDAMMENPAGCLREELEPVRSSLAGMREAIERNALDVKNREKVLLSVEKALKLLSPEPVVDYARLLEREGELERRIGTSDAAIKAEELKRLIEKAENDRQRMLAELSTLEKRGEELSNRIAVLKKKLLSLAEELQISVT